VKIFLVLLLLTFGCTSELIRSAQAVEHRNLKIQSAVTKRVALVIGNSAYPTSPLKNPINDAKDMAASLRKLGFDVIEVTNAKQKDMNRAIVQFGGKLSTDSVALFYFAGHGMQVKGKNYLLPIDAQIASEPAVRAEAVDVDTVLDQFSANPLSIVILDACRNNPFERKFRSIGGGLAQIDAPKGTLIAYATSPGKTAGEGTGRNGYYTSELLKAINQPGIKVEEVFKRVRLNVARVTGDTQIPWEASSLVGDFFFNNSQTAVVTTLSTDSGTVELESWRSAQMIDTIEAYQSYLESFPAGNYARLANAAVKKLEVTQTQSNQVSSSESEPTQCKSHNQCGTNLFCFGGTCKRQVSQGLPCTENTECLGALMCNQGVCVQPETSRATVSNSSEDGSKTSSAKSFWERLISENVLGHKIVSCFHPTANHAGAEFQSSPLVSYDGSEIRGRGKVRFLGGLSRSSYEMQFNMELKRQSRMEVLIRITPTFDNAPFQPNPSCAFRNWQRLQ